MQREPIPALIIPIILIMIACVAVPAASSEPGSAGAPTEPGRAYYDFGVFAFEDGYYGDAESNFRKALEKDAENPYYNHFLGKTYQEMKRHEEAMRYLKKAWGIDPNVSGLKYDLALQHFNMSDHRKAADLFTEVTTEDPSNVLARYYAGISSYKRKDYGPALGHFLGAAETSPSIKINGYYYAAMCYRKMGRIKDAVDHFTYVRYVADSQALQDNAIRWLAEIEQYKVKMRPFSMYVKVGHTHDDNVRLEPLDQEDIYTDEEDYSTVGYVSGRYRIVNREDFRVGLGYSHYQTVHDRLETYDLVGSIIDLTARYHAGPLTLGFTYMPSFYWLDDDTYMRRHQLKPEVMYRVTDELSTAFSYSYHEIDHVQDDNRDGHAHEPSIDAYYSLTPLKMLLFCGMAYEVSPLSHPDQEYRQLKARFGMSVRLPWEFNVALTGRYANKRYENADSFIRIRRDDSKYQGAVSISRMLHRDWLSVVVDFNYTENESNINVYNYRRQVATLSLSMRY